MKEKMMSIASAGLRKKFNSLSAKFNKIDNEMETLNNQKLQLVNINNNLKSSNEKLQKQLTALEENEAVTEYKKLFIKLQECKVKLAYLEEGVVSRLGWALTGAHNAYETRGSKEEISAVKKDIKEINSDLATLKVYKQANEYAELLNQKITNEETVSKNEKDIISIETKYELKNITKLNYKEQMETIADKMKQYSDNAEKTN